MVTALPLGIGSKYFLVFLLVISVLCHFRALFSLEAGEAPGARAITGVKFFQVAEYLQSVFLGY